MSESFSAAATASSQTVPRSESASHATLPSFEEKPLQNDSRSSAAGKGGIGMAHERYLRVISGLCDDSANKKRYVLLAAPSSEQAFGTACSGPTADGSDDTQVYLGIDLDAACDRHFKVDGFDLSDLSYTLRRPRRGYESRSGQDRRDQVRRDLGSRELERRCTWTRRSGRGRRWAGNGQMEAPRRAR